MHAKDGRERRLLYPQIEPYAQHMLKVSGRHGVHVEECGAAAGRPAVALHGGPGGGISPEMRRFFHPGRYRVVLMDQRGCGRSTPHAALDDNTTWDLIADIEAAREHLGIDKWLVFGGSWGSTLAIAYALTHPERVAGLVLRGIFLLTQSEISWFYQSGASNVFPEAFERYASHIPQAERGDLVGAYHKRLTSENATERVGAARAWARWEGEAISFEGSAALPARFLDDRFAEAFACIENHYFMNKGFFERDGWLLDNAHKLAPIPGRIVHGRYDMCTPLASAWALKKAWPQAQLDIIGDAGHSSLEPGIVDALVRATDAMLKEAMW